ncbi:MAG: PQQ-dependent sugar dehydrogenase [Myxococcota bacterium]|nr:PQQ-dependent sugar dehydrogenase [Myxococcota bacterium]
MGKRTIVMVFFWLWLGCQTDPKPVASTVPDMSFIPIGHMAPAGATSGDVDASMVIVEGPTRERESGDLSGMQGGSGPSAEPHPMVDLGLGDSMASADSHIEPRPEETPPDAGGANRPGTGPDLTTNEPAQLKLSFRPIDHDASAMRLTDLAFIPNTDELIAIDKDGIVLHMRLTGDRARRLGEFTIDDTWDDSDAGLISLTLDPAFDDNGFFYVGLSIDMETNVIRRYRFDPSDYAGIAASGVEIISVRGAGAQRSWHNVGSIGFTEEGYLWGLFGDKVRKHLAQDLHSPLGSLIRIIPNLDADGGYEVPADNPFADGSGHPAVYAKGMRSPWKGHYVDGHWFFGDIGLDRYEEINQIVIAGDNFGWPDAEGICEGDCADYIDPWVYYGRSSRHPFVVDDDDATAARWRSVWVGVVYRPQENTPDPYGNRWTDTLVFGDTFSGFVRARPIVGSTPSYPAGHITQITAMAQGPDGYVYATALGTWPADAPMQASPIYRVTLETRTENGDEAP